MSELLAQENGGSDYSTHPWGRAILPDKLLHRTDSPMKLSGLLADGKRRGPAGRPWARWPSDCGELQQHDCLAS